MAQAIGDSITYALGVAISPIPIIAVILMLLSKKAGANSTAFAIGWVLGIAGMSALVIAISGAIGTNTGSAPSHAVSVTKIVLGVLLALVGLRDWRKRPKPGERVGLPKWLRAIEQITPRRSGALAFALAAVNPKNLIMIVGGGLAIASAAPSNGDKVVAAVVFVVLSASTVVLPVVLYRMLGARAQPPLESWNSWLQAHNATVMAVLILTIAFVLVGTGVSGL